MQQINVNELKPHPRNNEFFDDMSGDKWIEFLDSVKSRGVIEPIVITHDKMIVSGHQRVRACKELGIDTIMCDVHTYENDDQILQDLLETNIRQRGDVGGSAKKVGKRLDELKRIYGIKHGGAGYYGNQYKDSPNNSETPITQQQIASMNGMSVDTMENYIMLSKMIPELEELLDTGIVTKTTALAMMKNLSPDEQEQLITSLDTTKKITQREVQKYIDEINELKSNPPKPDDYDDTKRKLNDYKQDYHDLRSQFDAKVKELQELKKQMENKENEEPASQYAKKLQNSTLLFCSKVATFIEQVGGFIWLTDEINKIPELEREGYIKSVHVIKAWADTMEFNINNKIKEIN